MIKIVFYNRMHNGDLFLSKGYMQRLIQTLTPSGKFTFSFAHKNSPKLFSDLGIEIISLNRIDALPVDDNQTVTKIEDTIYINTWVGAYRAFFTKTQEHATIGMINVMWFSIFYTLQSLIGVRLFRDSQERLSPKDGIPTTDWSKFAIGPANEFLDKTLDGKRNIILFCNGWSMSGQTTYSNIHLMEGAIITLAMNNPNYTFVCTHSIKIPKEIKNVYFTDDIFAGVLGGDMNEIAYLSTFCDMIIGKSSGPHIYSHVKDNVNRPCIFFTISDRQSDDYLYNFYDMEATHLFFVGKSEKNMTMILHGLIQNQIKYPQFAIINDEILIPIEKPLDLRNF